MTADDTVNLLAATADGSGIHFGDAAARRAATASFGFPYLVQLIGALAWRVTKDQVEEEVAQETIDAILKEAIDLSARRCIDQRCGMSPTYSVNFCDQWRVWAVRNSPLVKSPGC